VQNRKHEQETRRKPCCLKETARCSVILLNKSPN